tara:strand:+ start:225683 stop:226240 length:558 start_codon:yes stop_codon:yes gene_type:complete
MDNLSENLATNIRTLRRSSGWTQQQLADRSGLSRTNISYLESGEANPSIHLLMQVVHALGVSVEEIMQNPRPPIQILKAKDLIPDIRNGVSVYNLVGEKLPGFHIEKMEFEATTHMKGHPHLQGTHEYLINLSGGLILYVEGEKYELKTGDCIAFPGHCRHAYSNPRHNRSVNISVLAFSTPQTR